MNSRISDDVAELFLCFCEVARPESPDKDGLILQKLPESYDERSVLATLPKFVYPCEFQISAVQHSSFVLTNVESKWTFGFCRHDPEGLTALVFLSYLPWHEVFFRMLDTMADLIRSGEAQDLEAFIDTLLKKQLPEAGSELSVRLGKAGTFHCTIPSPYNKLPTIPENRNLTEYYNAVDANNMIIIFASMLHERRIVIKSRKLHRLSACVQAANTVLYPMNWQHIFIPLLPKQLTDYLLAPMPFLIGIPTVTWNSVRKSDIGEIVLFDADTNILETPFHDAEALPNDVVKFLKTQLRNQSVMMEDGFARAFLRALVQLIGGYRDALKFQQGQKITFNPEAFVESRPHNMHAFLRNMLQLQIFQQFIEERLDMLNAGLGFSDEFEFEACNYTAKVSNSAINDQYNNWKKQGTAFFKTVKNKTNPAMRSAVRTVKERGKDVKSAYKDIRTRLRKDGHHHHERPETSNSTFHRTRPLTIGPPVVATTTFKRQNKASSSVSNSRSNEYVPLSSPTDDLASPPPEDDMLAPRLNMDLLEDLQDMLNKQCSVLDPLPPVNRTLKPVCSLDGFTIASSAQEEPPNLLQPVRSPSLTHPPLSRQTLSLPLSSPSPTNPFAFSFNAPYMTDPFGFGTGTTSVSRNLNNPFNLPSTFSAVDPIFAPTTTSNIQLMSQCNGTADLIRLDSTSSPDKKSISRESSDDSIKFKTGLMNPLYPYYQLGNNASGTTPSTNGLLDNAFQNNTSFVHNSGSTRTLSVNKQDMDLLKEYGIDLKPSSTNSNNSFVPQDPFDLPFETTTTQSTPSTWATFDS